MTNIRSYWAVKPESPNSVDGSKPTNKRKKVKLSRKANLKHKP